MPRQAEEQRLRAVALKNAGSILAARQQAERELLRAKEALEQKTRELAHSLALIRATLESTTDGILVIDSNNRVADFNENFLQMWRIPRELIDSGRQPPQIVATMCGQFRDPGVAQGAFEELAASELAHTFDIVELVDGRVFERCSKIQHVDERNVGRVWSFRDVTGARRVEEALREETRVLEVLHKTGAALATKLDLVTLVQSVTDAATELSGARFGAFFENRAGPSSDAYQLYASSGGSGDAFERFGEPRITALFGPTFRGEAPIRSDDVRADPRCAAHDPDMPDGPIRSYLAVPVVSRSGEVIGGLFLGHPQPSVFSERAERIIVGVAAQAAVGIDNARMYEAAQRAAEERQQLLESERAARSASERMSAIKDQFLATLSHELRTPLNAIVGWAQILRRGDRGEADLHKGLETIERNARVQAQLIDDLLDMSRIVSGKVRLDIQPTDPSTFIDAAIETVRPAADAKGIRLEKAVDLTGGLLSADPNRLQQVVWNLLSNAIKFTPKGGKVQVVLERVNSHVELSITDTGIGIKREFLPHVFERFRQADASTTRRYGGLGLGLAIVKHLVELHGGSISVESPGEGFGTTFRVALPIMVVHQNVYGEERVHPKAVGPAAEYRETDLSGVKVLVVDDEPDARDMLQRVLGDCSAEVLTAGSAEEALSILESAAPHVLVSDIGMPDMDGYELLRRARAAAASQNRTFAAIALTAFARSEDRTRALRAGFLMHLAKPVHSAELIASVASVMGRTERRDE